MNGDEIGEAIAALIGTIGVLGLLVLAFWVFGIWAGLALLFALCIFVGLVGSS